MDDRPANRRGDWLRLTALLCLAAALRLWLLTHTEVPARDCIDFVRCAARLEEQPWAEVFRTTNQAPGYPLLIMAGAKLARLAGVARNAESYAAIAQLISALAGTLTVIPMYLAGRRLLGALAGLLAALLFQVLPVCMRVTSDGLSEGVFFLFAATALWLGLRALQQPSWRRFALCGFAAGLAYLTRPEGLELAAAVGASAIAAGWAARSVRLPLTALAGIACGLLPLVGAYVGVTGQVTRKPTSTLLLGTDPAPVARRGGGPPLAVFWTDADGPRHSRVAWSARSVLMEALKAGHYYTLALALVGLWQFRDRLRRDASLVLILILPAMHWLVLWRMAMVVGYVSERHAMMIAFSACFWTAGVLSRAALSRPRPALAAAAIMLVMLAVGLPATLRPLHANRAGHLAAGRWLAAHAAGHDEIIDPFAWAHFYAGFVLNEGKVAPALPEARVRFVVLEQGDNEHARLATMALARELARRGEPVYRWPERAEPGRAVVVVYRVRPGE